MLIGLLLMALLWRRGRNFIDLFKYQPNFIILCYLEVLAELLFFRLRPSSNQNKQLTAEPSA